MTEVSEVNPLLPSPVHRTGTWSPSAEHRELLLTILHPVVAEGRHPNTGWPTWDFVVRTMRKKRLSANDLYAELPRVDDGTTTGYRFTWRTNLGASQRVQDDEHVGLTMAGLHLANSFMADRVAALAASYAADEEDLPIRSDAVSKGQATFNDRATEFLRDGYRKAGVEPMTINAAAHLLMHEYPPLVIQTEPSGYEVRLGTETFAWLAGVSSSREYLEALWARLAPLNEILIATMRMMRGDQQTVTIVRAPGTADETRAEARALIQADHGYFDVATQIYEGDIVEVVDPRGGSDARRVSQVKVNNMGSTAMHHIAVTWGSPSAAPTSTGAGIKHDKKKIFLVHGRDTSAKHEIRSFIDRSLGTSSVTILDEQANSGRTLIEKFQDHADESGYAVVLLTPDDTGGAKDDGSGLNPRARQNVIFEMGYFAGKLGRDRIMMINAGVEQPSDLSGLVYIGYPGGNWQADIIRELQKAGFDAVLP